ncbi:hypothetical protein [Methanoculleus chikugoensis]|uniref:hypothetical protein n=1 Tax=Methanoculleus chikugoensis TaxID=118126 RepID=UPI0006CF9429|nr:hypothetical protein [Methanoculleus chikugoensis]
MHDCTPAHGDILELSGILDAFDEGLLIVGPPDNRVACINKHLRHLLGITRDAPAGTDADRFAHQALIPPRICGKSADPRSPHFSPAALRLPTFRA